MSLTDMLLGIPPKDAALQRLELYEKLNPAQPYIQTEEGFDKATTKVGTLYNRAYANLEVVRRGVDLLVNSSAEIDVDVKEKLGFTGNSNIKQKKLHMMLNHQPNEYQDISAFRRNIFMDLTIEGNAFIYFDGMYLYHLPSKFVTIKTDKKTFVKGYEYEDKPFRPDEIIHIKDNSTDTIYRGDSRLQSASHTMDTMHSMLQFQKNFFENGAVPGLVLRTKDILSQKIKDRILRSWSIRYNPKSGGRRPLILDGGLEVDKLSTTSFKELDFSVSIVDHEERILKALGVPPILLNAGNNANITPNLKLFYLMTVLPLNKMLLASLERFFSYDLAPNLGEIGALRPELKDSAEYFTKLVNNGVMLGAEAREELRLDPLDETEFPQLYEIRVPANVAGSATGVAGEEGGRPPGDNE
jgi:HK97 family phage portal protein